MGLLRDSIVMLAGLTCCAVPVFAADAIPQADGKLNTIVVTGKRLSVPDSEVKERVENALRSDPYFPDEHVTVTVKDESLPCMALFSMNGIFESQSASPREFLVLSA